MKIAAAVNLGIGLGMVWLVAYGISLDNPVRIAAWVVTALMLLAGAGAAVGISSTTSWTSTCRDFPLSCWAPNGMVLKRSFTFSNMSSEMRI